MFKTLEEIFDKRFSNEEYSILFNTKTGLQIIKGINGHEDPFALELPSLLDIGIMGTCENTCRFCYQGHVNKPNMLLDDFKTIIDEVKHHVNQVALGGRGDPNKHENFKEILEYCRENNVVPNYTTSGINLTAEEIELSKLCGAVAVSEYGKMFTYTALNNLMEAGVKTNIHIIFSRESYDKCMQILSGENVWHNTLFPDSPIINIDKLNAVVFLLFKPRGAGKYLHTMIPTESQCRNISRLVFNPKCKFKVGIDSCLVNRVTEYYTPTKLQQMTIDTCEGSRRSAYISPDMKFMPCSFADHVLWATPITKENTITDIWQKSHKFNQFRNILQSVDRCCPAILY